MKKEGNKLSQAMELLRYVSVNEQSNSHDWRERNMQDAMVLAIKSSMKFDEDDYILLQKSFSYGYWCGQSSNGLHYVESYYNLATGMFDSQMRTIPNISYCLCYEKGTGRQPFIYKNHRVYTFFRFKYNNLFCHVTGWAKDNKKLNFVGYENSGNHNGNDRGKRTLFSVDKKEWLEIRKQITI